VRALTVIRDLMLGGRHSRSTVASTGPSLAAADRWLKAIERTIPGIRRVRVGRTTWYEWRCPPGLSAHERGKEAGR
jgi:hypothetical protein